MELQNTCSVISGASGGIGRELLKKFTENGSSVFACVREKNADFLDFVEKINTNNSIKIVEMDLASEDSVKNAAKEIINSTKKIDCLVNNAAKLTIAPFLMSEIKDVKKLFEINFFSQILFSQYIVKKMIPNKNGSIINISSSSAIEGDEGRFAYSASKSALSITTKVMAKELAPFNIRCNSISPGLTNTEMLNKFTSKENQKNKLDKSILKRIAQPEEIADVIVFLASKKSSYITGELIKVDGGLI